MGFFDAMTSQAIHCNGGHYITHNKTECIYKIPSLFLDAQMGFSALMETSINVFEMFENFPSRSKSHTALGSRFLITLLMCPVGLDHTEPSKIAPGCCCAPRLPWPTRLFWISTQTVLPYRSSIDLLCQSDTFPGLASWQGPACNYSWAWLLQPGQQGARSESDHITGYCHGHSCCISKNQSHCTNYFQV